ncbi:MAG: hypothetical protein K2H80_02080, partial [Ureaplasma sp.]|nr:hypothetical protein [Ureaplasma sp.]
NAQIKIDINKLIEKYQEVLKEEQTTKFLNSSLEMGYFKECGTEILEIFKNRSLFLNRNITTKNNEAKNELKNIFNKYNDLFNLLD